MNKDPYKRLAERLDALPNGYPPTEDGAELRLLAKLFTPDEAELASQLRLTKETPEEVAARIGGEPKTLKKKLKAMSRKGLIDAGRIEQGLGFGLLPFAVGIYEYQAGSMDAELARLFEDYYTQAFGTATEARPAYHRVIPVSETVKNDMEIRPYESAAEIIDHAKAWGVLDCICRVQKALIGEPCDHPIDVCMVFNQRPGAFDGNPVIQAQTKEESLATLRRAAEAGLVHSVSNTQEDLTYICNCCTCSCGLLRGIAEWGIADVVASSPFVNVVDESLCVGCEDCIEHCQFSALSLRPEDPFIQIDKNRCVGCGVCVPFCPEGALVLVRRPEEEITPPPVSMDDWRVQRSEDRGLDINEVL
jgi:electron transport complex protein RnfB